MTNAYIKHYKDNNISPVTQEICDLNQHFLRRIRLYESLGMPKHFFKDKRILEIGAGSGYNALVTLSFEHKFYQIVEANEIAIKEMNNLFKNNNVDTVNMDIKNIFLEKFECDEKFDIIICENMLPCVKNNRELLDIINSHLHEEGTIILGCSDEISIFYDLSRRLVSNVLLQKDKKDTFNEKLDLLSKAFSNHIDTLEGCNRPIKDWCADNLLGQAFYNTNLSVSDVIEHYKKDFIYYNMSPDILTDDTWYKEMPLDKVSFNNHKINKFEDIWQNLFHYKVMEPKKNIKNTHYLRKLCREYYDLIEELELDYLTNNGKDKILKVLNKIFKILKKESLNSIIYKSISAFIEFIQNDIFTIESISNDMGDFTSSFGKGVQYISMIKQK